MTPLPYAARYFVALSGHEHQAYTEVELRRMYKGRVIESDTLIAPVNSTDWKTLGKVISDLLTPRSLPYSPVTGRNSEPSTIAHFVSSAPPYPSGPPFLARNYQRGCLVPLFGILAFCLLLVGVATGLGTRGSALVISAGGVALLAASGFCTLIAVALGLAEAAAARQDAILAALNWMIAQQNADAAKPSESAPSPQ